MRRDTYREWSPEDRSDAYRSGDYEGCRQYDRDFESSERAYDNWRDGGDFIDPFPDERFS